MPHGIYGRQISGELRIMWFINFINGTSVWVYVFIFFGKILEVALATLRHVLINRGERNKGTLVSMFEVIIWVVITGTVLNGFTSDIWKVVVFCAAFAIGIYLGSLVESKLALGLSTMQVISPDECTCLPIVESLRENGHAVTLIDGEGKDGAQRKVMIIYLKRNKIASATKLIRSMSDKCVIAVTDLNVMHGGFIKK